jgi:hypothetical protein
LSAKPSFADGRLSRQQIDQIFVDDQPSTKSFSCFLKIKKISRRSAIGKEISKKKEILCRWPGHVSRRQR